MVQQIVQTQIRLLRWEQSDLGLHILHIFAYAYQPGYLNVVFKHDIHIALEIWRQLIKVVISVNNFATSSIFLSVNMPVKLGSGI